MLGLLQADRVDWTSWFRVLAAAARGDEEAARARFADPAGFDAWFARWLAAATAGGRDPGEVADAMDGVNPVYIPRNHMVEAALTAATEGDLDPFRALVEVVADPFTARPGREAYAEPAPSDLGPYRTFCGT